MKRSRKHNVKDSLLDAGKHLGSGVAGMLAGAAVGRHSLWLGAATLIGGAYYGYDWVTSVGVGMVASNGFGGRQEESVDGLKDELTKAKERAVNSLKALGKKTYVDKFSPDLAEKMGIEGLGSTHRPLVFVGNRVASNGNFDTSEVDAIIRQLERGQVSGMVDGTGDLGNVDILELNGAEDITELNAVA